MSSFKPRRGAMSIALGQAGAANQGKCTKKIPASKRSNQPKTNSENLLRSSFPIDLILIMQDATDCVFFVGQLGLGLGLHSKSVC